MGPMIWIWASSGGGNPGGFDQLAFFEDFNDTAGIDMGDTGAPGFNFYRSRPFSWAPCDLGSFSVANSILTISPVPGDSYSNGSLFSTYYNGSSLIGFSARGGAYFEARIAAESLSGMTGHPAFWSFASEAIYEAAEPHQEVDFMERQGGGNERFGTAVWRWSEGSPTNVGYDGGNGYPLPAPTDGFHVYGWLWVPGDRMELYVDDVKTNSWAYSDNPGLDCGDNWGWPIILGSGEGWPMQVDWVKVWQ